MADNWQLKAVLSANAQGMIKALGDVGKMAKNTRKYLADIAGAAGNLGQRIALPSGLIGTLLAGFSGAAVKDAMVALADLEDDVSKFAATTGIAGAEFKRFQYLAKLSNVPFESLTGSMGKLNKQIYDAANGKGKDLAGLFSRLGIKMRDSNGQLRSAADMLPELADAFQRNENPVVRARMGMALFGKSWQEIMPMLAEGSAKINERMARFKELGLEVKDADAFQKQMEEAGKFGDALDDLSFVSKGLQTTIASALVPSITPLLVQLTNWVAENKEIIKNDVAKAAKALADQLKGIKWEDVRAGLKAVKDSIKWVVESLGGARNAMVALVLFMNAQTIVALGTLVASLFRAGLAFWAWAAKAYVAGNVAMASMIRTGIVAVMVAGGPLNLLKAAFFSTGAATKAYAAVTMTWMGRVATVFRAVGAAMLANPLGVLLGIATAAILIWQNWDTLKKWFTGFFDWVGEKFQSLLGWAKELAQMAGQFFGIGGSTTVEMAQSQAGPMAGQPMGQTPLVGNKKQEVGGKFSFEFVNAPPGLRLAGQSTKGNTDVDMSMGHRGFATGMP